MNFVSFTIVILSLICSEGLSASTTLKILTWWDYLSKDVIQNLEKQGYSVKITTYRTNEAAVSRLTKNQENFDLAIISSVAMSLLGHVIGGG